MPHKYRLSRADFGYTRAFKRLHGVLFNVSYGRIPSREGPGGACIVSTKVSKSAVVRNRIKRRARAALVLLLEKSPAIVVLCHAKSGAAQATAGEIHAELEGLLAKI